MGYIKTVLGFGANHMSLPLSLLFKKAIKCHDGGDEPIPLSDNIDSLYELVQNNSIELSLQDDIIDTENPEIRDLAVEDEDDVSNLLNSSEFKSKECGCLVGTCGPCFSGIIITEGSPSDFDVEENIIAAKKWISALKQQGRFPQEAKLVMVNNCCS